MTQRELVQRIGRLTGLRTTSQAQHDIIVDFLNDAAQELYDSTDLPRSLMEVTVSVDSTDPTICVTLPQCVYELRGVRNHQGKITLHDRRPRYMDYPWPKGDHMTYRILRESAIERSIDNSVPLYMEPITFEGALEVSIVGSTADADELHATFDASGAGTAATVLWTDIYSIGKDSVTPVDVVLRSGTADGDIMATIPAYSPNSRYLEIELLETMRSTCGAQPCPRCFDILYKPAFRPLYEPTSTFQLQNYDLPIINKAVELYRLSQVSGSEQTQNQIAAAQEFGRRVDRMMKENIGDRIQGEELLMQFGRPRGDTKRLRGLRAMRYGTYSTTYRYNR